MTYFAASVATCLLAICAASSVASGQVRSDTVVDGIVVTGGTLVRYGSPLFKTDILLQRSTSGIRIREISPNVGLQATDSVDARGLYIHPGMDLDYYLRAGGGGILTLRETESVGSRVRLLIGFREREIRWLMAAENRPNGPVDDRVGCYTLERGAWSNPAVRQEAFRDFIPDGVRLHWQYLWTYGREQWLVATDTMGMLPSARIRIPSWQLRGDSVSIVFSDGFGGVAMYVGRSAWGLEGRIQTVSDVVNAPSVDAPVRLRRITCPAQRR